MPLDNTYNHTILFTSTSSQQTYFAGKAKYTATNYTYQRATKNVIRVNYKADLLYDCNYLMFQNTSFGTKWFYAFITSVEYVNNTTSNVYFEIDEMQTWLFDFDLGMCFVEREHSETDNIGDNIKPEPVDCGEYIRMSYSSLMNTVNYIIVLMTVSSSTSIATGVMYDRVYSGCDIRVFNSSDADGVSAYINENYSQDPSGIISMYMAPKFCVGDLEIPDGGVQLRSNTSGAYEDSYFAPVTVQQTLDGYTPKNRKMYTYPYNYLCVDNGNGDSLVLRYEFFDTGIPKFRTHSTISQPVQLKLRPVDYKMSDTMETESVFLQNTEFISMASYPMCSWASDTFAAWVAQNSVPIAVNTAVGTVQGAMAGGIAGAGASLATSVVNTAVSAYQASIKADVCHGNISSANVDFASASKLFMCGRYCVTAGYAKMIDDFFTMFGYSTRECKVPNRSARPHWNYVKTLGCVVTGSVPADSMSKICQIHDNGITYWKNGDEIGDYTLVNLPT